MDPVASVVEKVKGFAKSGQDLVEGLLYRRRNSSRRNPIEILKRLQREAFSDLMKLRDRQDKVEKILSFHKTSKGNPFQEASTHVRGEFDVLGAVLLMGDVDQQQFDALDKAGIRPGIYSRFTFESTIHQKDTLVAEFVANQKGNRHLTDVSGSPLSLNKVYYMANISDWFSAIAIPIGGQCRDIDFATNSLLQGRETDFSCCGPPLLNQHKGSAIGFTIKKSNIVASLAQSISGLEMQQGSDATGHCFSTFGQLICQLPRGTKLSLLGLHKVPKLSSKYFGVGALAIPVGFLRHNRAPESNAEASAQPVGTLSEDTVSTGFISLKLESELDDCTRVGGWIEMKNSNPEHVRWAVTLSDNCENELGWGLSVGGMIGGAKNWDQFQVESHLKLNLARRFSLKPGLAYVDNGNGRTLALTLGSGWCM